MTNLLYLFETQSKLHLSESGYHGVSSSNLVLLPSLPFYLSHLGYARIVLAALSLYFMKGNPKVCTFLYCVSCLLDAFDGMAARALGQVSLFSILGLSGTEQKGRSLEPFQSHCR